MPNSDFAAIFAALKPVLAKHAKRLSVQKDTAAEYSLVGTRPSPFPQHKGHPMWFGAVRKGKGYVSFHLMPLYMNDTLSGAISPALKKRMQGKSCFNFKAEPEADLISELQHLTEASVRNWAERDWI